MFTDLILGTNDIEALEPLRSRYSQQHYALRKFYYECSNLKYLTGLINVPKLGQVCLPSTMAAEYHTDIVYRNPQISWTTDPLLTYPLVLRPLLSRRLLPLIPRRMV